MQRLAAKIMGWIPVKTTLADVSRSIANIKIGHFLGSLTFFVTNTYLLAKARFKRLPYRRLGREWGCQGVLVILL